MPIVRAAVAAQMVVVTYEAVSKSGKAFRNTEAITIRNEQIDEVEVYFDCRLFPHERIGSPRGKAFQ